MKPISWVIIGVVTFSLGLGIALIHILVTGSHTGAVHSFGMVLAQIGGCTVGWGVVQAFQDWVRGILDRTGKPVEREKD